MARQEGQKMRFTDNELSLMKSVFADNEDLLFIIRKVLLQFELTSLERETLDKQLSDNMYELLRKTFLPTIDPDAPLFQLTDLVMSLTNDLKGRSQDEMYSQIIAKELEIRYLEQQFEVLKGNRLLEGINLKDLGRLSGVRSKGLEEYENITARNYILSYIDSNIQQLKFLAGKKEESVEETVNRLQKDSTK